MLNIMAYATCLNSESKSEHMHNQGRSQRGVQGVQLNPPLQINDIHDYCYALEKLRAEMYIV